MANSNTALVNELRKNGWLKTPRLVAAFRAVDRACFVLKELQKLAYENTALPIGYGQTISQPLVVAFMLELLEVRPGDRVLDIGCGSGYTTALLSRLVGSEGRVMGLELQPELTAQAIANLAGCHLSAANCQVFCANGRAGFRQYAPYQRILVSAALAQIKLPAAWRQQLAASGIIVAPINDAICRFTKSAGGKWSGQEFKGFAFVPLC